VISLSYYLVGATLLFTIGLYCLIAKRNMIRLVMGIDILNNAANLSFIAFSSHAKSGFTEPLAHAIVIMSIAMGGCVIAIAMTLVLHAYRHYKTLDVRRLRRLKW